VDEQHMLPTVNSLDDYQTPKPHSCAKGGRVKYEKDKKKIKLSNCTKGTKKSNKRGNKNKFDSTLGYPGEGPPRGSRGGSRARCRTCHGPHQSRFCPNTMKRVYAAIQRDECFHNGDCKGPTGCASGSDEPTKCNHIRGCLCVMIKKRDVTVNTPPSPKPLAEKQPVDHNKIPNIVGGNPFDPKSYEPEVVNQPIALPNDPVDNDLNKILADIRSKCRSMLFVRDLASESDEQVVLQSMWAIARKSALREKTVESESVIISRIYQEVHSETLKVISDKQINMAVDFRTFSKIDLIKAAWNLRPIGHVQLPKSVNPISGLVHLRAMQPYSLIDDRKIGFLMKTLILFIYLVAISWGPALEETAKRCLLFIFNATFPLMFSSRSITWAKAARLVPSLIIAIFEVRKRKGFLKTVIIFVARFFGHSVLSHLDYGYAIVAHACWNVIMDKLDTTWKLSIFNEDITKSTEVYADVCCDNHVFKNVELQDDYDVNPGDPECHAKFGVRRMWGILNCVPTVFRSCTHNEQVSMEGRVGKRLPQHNNPDAVVRAWKTVASLILPFILSKTRRRRRMNLTKWLASFIPRRRDQLLKLFVLGYGEYARVASSFIKRETALKTRDEYVFKDPRFIQGCPLEMTLDCGRSIRTGAKELREGLRPKQFCPTDVLNGQQIVYTCGLNNDQIGGAFSKSIECITSMCDPGEHVIFLEDDQSRFDMHLTEGAFTYLQCYYKKRFPRKVCRALRRKKSTGRTNNGTTYSVPYTMQSGWPDTSFGDTLVNATMKYSIHGVGRKWISIICGDDSVTVTTDKELKWVLTNGSLEAQYATFGMEVEAHIRYQEEDVEFCSARFFKSGNTHILVPKVGKLLGKLCYDMVDRNPQNQRAWLRGICETLAHYGQIDPLLSALSKSLKSQLGEGKVIVDTLGEYRHKYGKPLTASMHDIRYYYAHHYGFTTSNLVHLEKVLLSSKVGDLACDPLLVALATHDAN